MAIVSWPAELPQHVLQEGYSEKSPDGRLRTQTDWGPGKVRRRYSAAVRPITAQILVDVTKKARFDRFWNEDTNGGTDNFSMPDQILDGAPILDTHGNQLTDKFGNPLLIRAKWLCRFGEPATTTPYGALFTISFQLLVLP